MYPSREEMATKTHQLIHVKLFPEALALAQEMAERWPEHPVGWSYLGEIYGGWFGLGVKAAESIQRGLACPEVTSSVYHEALLANAIVFAADDEMIKRGIAGILQYFPKHAIADQANNIQTVTNGVYPLGVLRDLHLNFANSPGVEVAIGSAASQWDLIAHLSGKMGNPVTHADDLGNLLDDLRNAAGRMQSLREQYGLADIPADKHAMRRRAALFEEYADDYFPNDGQVLNRWAATYQVLEEYDNFHRIIERVLAIRRYDKPLTNKSTVLIQQANKRWGEGDTAGAVDYLRQAQAAAEEALRIPGGEAPAQALAAQKLQQARGMLAAVQADQAWDYGGFQNTVTGLRRLFQEEMRELVVAKAGIRFKPEMAAQASMERFDLSAPSQVQEFIQELLGDFNPAVAAAVLAEIKLPVSISDLPIRALLDVATDPVRHGAMHRMALETFAIFIVNRRDLFAAYLALKHYADIFPDREPAMLAGIDLTFGWVLGQVLRSYLRNPATADLLRQTGRSEIKWWQRLFG